ncbi:high affinity cationic amino acid transporter 1-like [Centruroides vittatus]|uniref:high affinity cationic amino acid transporter 1-like n=1 Tax=Centruroides vittatus TaxID=120091 RepID=UPI00350FFE6C
MNFISRITGFFSSTKEKFFEFASNYKRAYVDEFPSSLIRTKHFSERGLHESRLSRCLNVFDITFLGIGSTLGLGMYVLAGQIASNNAGPAVTLSYFIAALASVFAGLCYAEFGARVPKAGSAYVYSYVTVGEFIAFIIGWNLILEYAIGTASVARGYSGYIDSLIGNKIQNFFERVMPIDIPYMSSYPDFFSFGIVMLLTVLLSFGVKESSKLNNVFTIVNLLVVVYVVICGSFKADIHNWELPKSEIPKDRGDGGFFPYGINGMLQGAAVCFYSFVGFDCVATLGEEVKNPQKSIPIGIVGSLVVCFLAYFSVSAIQTLMWPYYDQSDSAPLPNVFAKVGWPSAKWIISVGALAGLSTSMLGGMFPLPRVLFALANDGLIFKFISRINERFKTPIIATIISGVLTALLAMMFNVHELASMMSIGTLMAYTLVAISVLILRYKPTNMMLQNSTSEDDDLSESNRMREVHYNNSSIVYENFSVSRNYLYQIFNLLKLKNPTKLSSRVSVLLISFIGLLLIGIDVILCFFFNKILEKNIGIIIGLCLLTVLVVVAFIALSLQPKNQEKTNFKVPFVPFTPLLSIFINIYLILYLPENTWTRFAIWMAIGFAIYFGYGIVNSSERETKYRIPPEQIIINGEGLEDDPLLRS